MKISPIYLAEYVYEEYQHFFTKRSKKRTSFEDDFR